MLKPRAGANARSARRIPPYPGDRVRRFVISLLFACGACAVVVAATTLDIYFIDVEGGQATLIVTPAGQSLLVDTGFPSTGTFDAVPGEPAAARDANRIAAVARAAGVKRIDYLLITHFHADHDGGVVELAKLLPIRTFVDHADPKPEAESVAGTLRAFDAYAKVRATGRHLQPAPGERLPLKGADAVVVSAGGSTLTRPLAEGGRATPSCKAPGLPAEEPNENPRSTGIVVQYGRFRFLDLGDLSGPPLFALACPASLVGPVDVYLVAHHGGPDAADPATFAAFRPRVAIVNNGSRKGGVRATLSALAGVPGLAVWQLHRREDADADNTAEERIANVDDSSAHWIRVRASRSGSFSVTNGRTGQTVDYAR
jgi:beta-lactamase superfamily II metal-dependent hydrolase